MHPSPMECGAVDRAAPAAGARKALALLLAINLFNYIDRYVLAAVLPKIGAEMLAGDPRSEEKLGWLATAFLLSYMLASPIFGWLADRFSRWALVGAGVIVWSIASGESGRAELYIVLLITRMFVGIGEAAYGPAAPTLIADFYPLAVRGRVMAWFYMAIPVGSALGYALGGLMAQYGHWRWAFYSVVPPGILLGILCFFMPRPAFQTSGSSRATGRARLADYLALLRNRSYVYNCLGMAALTFAIGGISHWMPTYVSSFRGAGSIGQVNMLFGAMTVVTGIVGTLLGGIAGDWLRTRISGAYFVVSGAGLLICFPFFVAMLFVPFPYAWICIFIAEFFLFFNTGPSNTALANVTHPSVRASAFALNILFIHALGDAISPPIIGRLTDHFDRNMNIGFGLVGAMMVIGGLIWLLGARYLDADTARAAAADPTAGSGPDGVGSSRRP
ncbi:spinster family MFS transporter [Fontivita pretiosa]|uniref:spinster family MFS transporter n=1 Tax=Fontivita pretiosa TaxID=2989684 RepID=UPI003D16A925